MAKKASTPPATPPPLFDAAGQSVPDALAPTASALDRSLRPGSLAEFVGQREVVDNLSLAIRAAKARGESLDHLLLSGLPGLGKTTLAHLVASEMGVGLKETTAPVLQRAADLAGVLTNLEPGDVLFIDEIHRLPPTVEEYLYSAMEQFVIDIVIDQGPGARSLRLDLPRFTLVGATTREGLLSAPFRSRFGLTERLEVYPVEDLAHIVRRSAGVLAVEIDADAATLRGLHVAWHAPHRQPLPEARARPRPGDHGGARRASTSPARACGGWASTRTGSARSIGWCSRRSLNAGGLAVGLKTLAASVGEDERTIEDVYEPHLLRCGMMLRTPQGRRPTPRAYEWLGRPVPRPAAGSPEQGTLPLE